jgi:hypothetical protein
VTLLTALLIWIFLTWGLTYTVSRAEILERPRVLVVMYFPLIASLISCRACTSFWTGQAAACTLMGIMHALVPWHAWIYGPPIAGFCAIGLIDLLAFTKRGDPNG